MDKKPLPIGIEDFVDIQRNDFYYNEVKNLEIIAVQPLMSVKVR